MAIRQQPCQMIRTEHHSRVEVVEKELGLHVRCHDCGAMARQDWPRITLDSAGRLVPVREPLPRALDRLDRIACDPLGQLALEAVAHGD